MRSTEVAVAGRLGTGQSIPATRLSQFVLRLKSMLKNSPIPIAILLLSMCVLTPRIAADDSKHLPAEPILGSDWEIQPDPKREAAQTIIPYRWSVFKNRKSSDLLSFATLTNDKVTDLEFYTDTALEIFPEGKAVWTNPANSTTIVPLSVKTAIIRNGLFAVDEVLTYCFISESPDRTNLMAQGEAWIQNRTLVFVQHTSSNPISYELVREISRDYIKRCGQSTQLAPYPVGGITEP